MADRSRERFDVWPARILRSRRTVSLAVVVTFAIVTPHVATAGETTKPPEPATEVQAINRIEITSTASSWDNLSELFMGSTPASPFGEGSVFVMRGELRNKGDAPVQYIVLRYELLDDKGNVVNSVEGFNRSAEQMRPDEEGHTHPQEVKAIPAGGVDSYRMVFFHDEVPRFTSQRVRVSEVHLEKK
ncbi:MAG TPA: FxLYD domain-containing protein [Candidatus Limnocylindrales bacterium]|nr:FxLYD domain-containing protein [Candidatus Limnocylindrales bacterium]